MIPATTAHEASREHILFAMVGASLTLVMTIIAGALLPTEIGVTLAFVVLLAAVGAVGAFLRQILRDPT